MVHYGQHQPEPEPPLPACPNCNSRRTEIIGRLEDGRTLIVRCNACGAHSTIMSARPLPQLNVHSWPA